MSTAAASPTPAAHERSASQDPSATRRPSRAKTAIRALLALTALAVALLVGRFYLEYKTLNVLGDPGRIRYNDRNYYAGDGGPHLTLAQLESRWSSTTRTVDTITPLPGTSIGARDVVAPAGRDCTTVIAVKENDGRLRQYALSGGC